MKRVFVDTNIFIRYLTNDPRDLADKVERFFDLAQQSEIWLVTGPPVLFEVAWTLKSFYKMTRERIYECLTAILGIPGLEVSDIGVMEEALELYKKTSADLSDAYVAVLSKKVEADAVATFNEKHFKDLDVKIYALE